MKTATATKLKGFELEDPKSVVKGDAAQFTQLYVQHQALVRSVIFQIAGSPQLSDLVQEAFIRIWKGLPEFREEAKITSWIYRVSANVALDSLRLVSRQAETFDYDFSEIAANAPDSENELMNRQLVEMGLKALSEEHRTVVVLALIHDRPLAEVAEILGISEGTVKSRLHYGKEQFRRFLSGQTETNEVDKS